MTPNVYLTPGKTLDVHGLITNPNEGPVQISGLAGVVSVTPATGQVCSADNYNFALSYFDAANIGGTRDLGGFQNPIEWYGTLSMVNSAANQDGCKNATVTVTYEVH